MARATMWLALLAVGGCSQMPDELNPVEWWKGTVELFSGEDEDQLAETPPPPGGDKDFPKLSRVPERPRAPEDSASVVEGLVADRKRARYSSEIIRRQGAPTEALSMDAPAMAKAPPPPPEAPGRAAAGGTAPAQTAAVPTAPPAPPAVAAPAPGAMVPSAEGVAAVYRSRLAQQRPGRIGTPTRAPANALVPGAESFDTLVVSSLGVQGIPAPRPPASVASAAPAPAAPPPLPGNSVKVATIIFSHGSSRLDARDRRILETVVKLHRQSGGKLRVVGHASSRTRAMDPARHRMVNLKVSQARADAVARGLTRFGLARADIAVNAKGDGHPLYYEVMPTGETGNRRAEVYIDY